MRAYRRRPFDTAANGAMIGLFWASAAAAASPDACAILTQSEVAAALGVAVGAGQRLAPNETSFCSWQEQGKSPMQARNVAISFLEEQTYRTRKMAPSLNNTPEGGIGDEAYFSKDKGMPISTLTVKKGRIYFEVTARGHDASAKGKRDDLDQQDKEVDRAIARLIVKKL